MKQQVLDEQRELFKRIGMLHAFLEGGGKFSVSESERLRLYTQLHIMEAYNNILTARMLAWSE